MFLSKAFFQIWGLPSIISSIWCNEEWFIFMWWKTKILVLSEASYLIFKNTAIIVNFFFKQSGSIGKHWPKFQPMRELYWILLTNGRGNTPRISLLELPLARHSGTRNVSNMQQKHICSWFLNILCRQYLLFFCFFTTHLWFTKFLLGILELNGHNFSTLKPCDMK